MSERGSFRGRGGGRGARSQQKSGGGGGAQEKPKKENILDLGKYMDKEVQVKFNGGREGKLLEVVQFAFNLLYFCIILTFYHFQLLEINTFLCIY